MFLRLILISEIFLTESCVEAFFHIEFVHQSACIDRDGDGIIRLSFLSQQNGVSELIKITFSQSKRPESLMAVK